MKRRIPFLCTMFVLGFASIGPSPAGAGLHATLRGGDRAVVLGGIVVPPEWGGIWSSVDSVYDCKGTPLFVYGGTDTLCSGQPVIDAVGSEFQYSCDGTVTATTVDVTCTASGPIFGECILTSTITLQGSRSGDTSVVTATMTEVYTGPFGDCFDYGDQCSRSVSRATRIAPEPAAYCATPAEATSWGQVKSHYR